MKTSTLLLALASAATFALPAGAASSAASSASDSLATSSGSVSASLRGSSGSSTGNQVAEGDYRIVEVAAATDRPGDLRLTLRRGEAVEDAVFLTLPRTAVEGARLAQGDVVTAKHRPYGIEFQDGRTREAFFLVLDDDWHRELKTVPVAG